jgi:fructokinase
VLLDGEGTPKFDILTDAAYDYINLEKGLRIDWNSVVMVYYGTLIQRTNRSFEQIQKILKSINTKAKCFYDMNLRPPFFDQHIVQDSLFSSDILKLNTDELLFIQDAFNGPEEEQEMVPWTMETFKIEMLALTRGKNGSTVKWNDYYIDAPAKQINRIADTVGAGDAYAAMLAAGWLRGLELEKTVETASEFSAHICSVAGAVPEDNRIYSQLRKILTEG